jgi:hypothetical protein
VTDLGQDFSCLRQVYGLTPQEGNRRLFLCTSVVIVCSGIAKPLRCKRYLTLEQYKVFRVYFMQIARVQLVRFR